MLCLDSCHAFVWTDTGGESAAFLDGGPTKETPSIFARRSSCKQSGKQRCIYFVSGSHRTHSYFDQCVHYFMTQTGDEFHETLQRLRGGDIKVHP